MTKWLQSREADARLQKCPETSATPEATVKRADLRCRRNGSGLKQTAKLSLQTNGEAARVVKGALSRFRLNRCQVVLLR